MISANELRIGNWLYDTKGKSAQINEIKRHPSGERAHIVTFQGLGHFGGYVEDLKPIPLTPEILERCGFESSVNNKYVIKAGTIERSKFDSHYLTIKLLSNGNHYASLKQVFISNVPYLHQLQNLYFALTGTELEIKNLVEV